MCKVRERNVLRRNYLIIRIGRKQVDSTTLWVDLFNPTSNTTTTTKKTKNFNTRLSAWCSTVLLTYTHFSQTKQLFYFRYPHLPTTTFRVTLSRLGNQKIYRILYLPNGLQSVNRCRLGRESERLHLFRHGDHSQWHISELELKDIRTKWHSTSTPCTEGLPVRRDSVWVGTSDTRKGVGKGGLSRNLSSESSRTRNGTGLPGRWGNPETLSISRPDCFRWQKRRPLPIEHRFVIPPLFYTLLFYVLVTTHLHRLLPLPYATPSNVPAGQGVERDLGAETSRKVISLWGVRTRPEK